MSKRIAFINFLETITSFIRNDATVARVWQLQDRDGTLADDTDLALKADIADGIVVPFYIDNISASVTGTTDETIVNNSAVAPIGTFGANDIVDIDIMNTKSGTAQSVIIKLYVNTSVSLVGATQLDVLTHSSSALYSRIVRRMIFKNSLTSQKIFSATTSSNSDVISSAVVATSLTVDFTKEQHFFITYDPGNATDTITCECFDITIKRK